MHRFIWSEGVTVAINTLMNRRMSLSAGEDITLRVRDLIERGQIAMIGLGDRRALVIRADTGLYFDPDNMAVHLAAHLPAGSCHWQLLDRKDQLLQDYTDEFGRPLDELLWMLAWSGYSSQNSCLTYGARRDDVIQLLRWPNLTRLPHNHTSHRLAALFSARATSVALAGKILGVDEAEVLRFYTAAWHAGLLRRINRPLETPALRIHRHQALLGSLMRHLRGGRAAT